MCDKAVDTFPFVSDSIPDQYITQEMCNKVADSYVLDLAIVPA